MVRRMQSAGAETFTNPQVAAFAKDNLISLKINVDKKEGSELFKFNGMVMQL